MRDRLSQKSSCPLPLALSPSSIPNHSPGPMGVEKGEEREMNGIGLAVVVEIGRQTPEKKRTGVLGGDWETGSGQRKPRKQFPAKRDRVWVHGVSDRLTAEQERNRASGDNGRMHVGVIRSCQ